MPTGLRHTDETKAKISEAAIRTMQQSNAGFRQRVECPLCEQSMCPANMARHYPRCLETRGIVLNGKQLSVKEIKVLQMRLKKAGWDIIDYIRVSNEQNGLCALCGKLPNAKRLSADHCHLMKKPRGLLCEKCNSGLGLFNDDYELLLRAATYLQSHDLSRINH